MDVTNVLLMLFLCNVGLSESLQMPKFEAKIDGWERECEAPHCRYTGKIIGSVTSEGFFPEPEICVFIIVETYYEEEQRFHFMCSVAPLFPCTPCYISNTACNCTGENPMGFSFYPFRGAVYRVAVEGQLTTVGEWPMILPRPPINLSYWAISNVFDTSIKPENWDPIYVHPPYNTHIFGYYGQTKPRAKKASTNGNVQRHAGTNIVGSAILFAILFTEIMLNE
ncbi:uncharacterized protein LOC131952115 isoform X2 [Physella acuta]|nr:uncharacterized protein LOC131952115 isoform X2 [Physella acuta]XP_059170618.1 uncharacterized protein LOC131952115 isoform X2 [Physella acuta]XP_059170619.1 uncharacterized protein LOC131952115 isoform X2 [Physella acuta]XP_059170620.1 uncharacterized protein LOC131952115 isoform X2 [Physella acuta]XP_059170621.1 uncharacterized protein LOC131952115 isoform X2 [Physella acuta]